MKWFNLKSNKCPDCGKLFTDFSDSSINCKCGFKISTTRFKEIVDEQTSKPYYTKKTNQESLNDF